MSSEAAILGVTLNRDRLNEVTAPESFAADGEFAVALRNEGEPVHVHLRFDGPLAAVASVAPPNHYVDEEATRTVRVTVAPVDEAVTGTLEVVVGHGAEATTVPVRVSPSATASGDDPAAGDEPAPGDDPASEESSEAPAPSDADPPAAESAPAGEPDNDGGSEPSAAARRRLDEWVDRARDAADTAVDGEAGVPSPEPGTLAVAALAAAALVGAGIVAVTLDGLAVTLGVVAVFVAVLAAGFLLLG
ncbi:DUF7524 family protein [Halobaculum magnesiiphilum]|uniref:Uncharacterized protein n=1 Tax=Halobaculum magnesiiphilum TaxID=1017351 RepID=A0A8T8WFP6_9EURY|nr:hypothetical protein [Halobaculum magnesiiphilum]QZP38679.1 hypothetical protein K6T50_05945 [Halobaculum magnesiiphilum]